MINEIFFSIQGESVHAGRPCVFLRLTGCNLRCSYCDTPYAYDEGRPLAVSDIIKRLSAYSCRLVEITGGEPLLRQVLQNWSKTYPGRSLLSLPLRMVR